VATTVQEALQLAGGFGKMQVVLVLMIVLRVTYATQVIFIMPFMQLTPAYKCTSSVTAEPYNCKPADFCGKSDVHAQIDWNSENSLHNWVEKFDLTC